MQCAQVSNTIYAAGVALLTDNQDGQDGGNRLRDNGEVHTTDTTLEHGNRDDESEDSRHSNNSEQSKTKAVEGFPEPWQFGELVPVHKVRNTRSRLNRSIFR